ncbi:MAG: hypothetical protein J6K89_03745 [Oscillospiraceae bacterium]|nr:hypothetical protein [Oscillospiraceae bacterium]
MEYAILFIVEMLALTCVCWVVFFLSTFAHELGHALVYMLITGNTHWHIRIGSGKCLLRTQRFSIKLAVFDGVFEPKEDGMELKKAILTLLGGPLFSLILVGILLYTRLKIVTFGSVIISLEAIRFISSLALFVNTSILLYSLAPIHYFWGETKGMESDILRIVHIIKSKRNN